MKPTDAALTLRTLGDAALVRPAAAEGTEPSVVLARGKPLALLIYLAVSPSHSASRDTLIDLLWADLETDRARHALRQALWQLRQILGDAITGRDELTLVAQVDSDRDAFIGAVAAGHLEQATAIYRGPFLPVFAAPGGAEFEHWAEVERSRLQEMFLSAATIVVQRWLSVSRFREAQRLALRVRETAPSREASWRLVIESLVAGHDLLQARLEADRLEDWIRQEGHDPEPATKAAVRSARLAEPGVEVSVGRDDLVAELIGRDREFSTVVEGWESIVRGQLGTLHIHVSSPAGYGKTRLLADAGARLQSLKARMISLRANPGEQLMSCALASQLASGLAKLSGAKGVSPGTAATLVALNPTLSAFYSVPLGTTAERVTEVSRHRSLALAELAASVSDEAPVAILLDDTHWLDDDSFQLIEALIHGASSRILFVTAGRPGRGRAIETPATIQLELPPITTEQTRDLLRSLAMLPDTAEASCLVEALHRNSAGSPLLTLEALHLALERGTLRLTESAWQIPELDALTAELESGAALKARIGRLEPEAAWALLILARAGTPLSTEELSLTVRQPAGLEASLIALERRGFAHRLGPSWQPAHDEIAAAVLESEPVDRLTAADLAIGRMLLRHRRDSRDLIRAARHLEAGTDREVQLAFRRFVERDRATGRRLPLATLARELLGNQAPDARINGLVGGLPASIRFGLDSPHRLTAAVAAITLGIAAAIRAFGASERADARLYLFDRTDPRPGIGYPLSLRADQWPAGEPIRLAELTATTPFDAPGDSLLLRVIRVDGQAAEMPNGDWVFSSATGDSGVIDVFRRTKTGTTVRLTNTPRDDNLASIAPDGSRIAITTARYSPIGADRYELATLDPQGTVTRGTYDSAEVFNARWSPSGARIAFERRFRDGRTTICWAEITTLNQARCRDGAEPGWVTDALVSGVKDENGSRTIEVADLDGEHLRTLFTNAHRLRASPDGRWLAVMMTLAGTDRPAWYLAPSSHPADLRRLDVGDRNPASISIVWRSNALNQRRYLDTLHLVNSPERVNPGQTFRLVVRATDPRGEPVAYPGNYRWRTGDSAIVTVDSTGLFYARKPGAATVWVSAGGWRTDSMIIRVEGTEPVVVRQEDWRGRLEEGWIGFGNPAPALMDGPGALRAFHNNGDGSFVSGALSRQSWGARDGLGVEASVSAPITRAQWQLLQISLVERADSVAVPSADQLAQGAGLADKGQCGWNYPSYTTTGRRHFFGSAGFSHTVPSPAAHSTGAWFTVRIQLFPDGRCGLAIDGRPVAIHNVPLDLKRPFGIFLGSASAGTKMLHGPLTVWTGVRQDLDWSIVH